MAKQSLNTTFKNAEITEEDGIFTVTESSKDETKVYNLTEVLRSHLNMEGLSIRIAKDSELPSEE
ncbi:hypothetical protein [Clostridium botulinum]|uniref:Bacillus phage SPbeta YonK domain-containing protein n=1 Tax=Clostridium botulinum B str. Osaka05 TaxID=1407017 RepID=A0A060N380_CLOBO|nr:hypothetical protein [Clostridium botulinum]MBY6842777.1 hypothetical protein [Clostridium botulinum]BAO04916.1 uncharacterized protein CBO05P1_197 [Clostridium botulinum B str. Osaka05]